VGGLSRLFTFDDIPGVLRSPADTAGGRPLVLLSHGGCRPPLDALQELGCVGGGGQSGRNQEG
jgi:hypothetical protein